MKLLPPKISIVVPTKDEQDAIAGVVQDCREALRGIDHEIIVVDEFRDNTAVEAERAGARVVRQVGRGSWRCTHPRVLLRKGGVRSLL